MNAKGGIYALSYSNIWLLFILGGHKKTVVLSVNVIHSLRNR